MLIRWPDNIMSFVPLLLTRVDSASFVVDTTHITDTGVSSWNPGDWAVVIGLISTVFGVLVVIISPFLRSILYKALEHPEYADRRKANIARLFEPELRIIRESSENMSELNQRIGEVMT